MNFDLIMAMTNLAQIAGCHPEIKRNEAKAHSYGINVFWAKFHFLLFLRSQSKLSKGLMWHILFNTLFGT